ncbi:MAG: hypothetical protein JWM47_3595 [Acidimicrobiales bacterium]|nr:hypothetical protein [Acidimicrobiales bacterium]
MTTVAVSRADRNEIVERLGRVAIATQGVLYTVVGLLAVQVAQGDRDAKPSQKGALQSVARQPFGRGLLLVLVAGLVAHAAWRLVLAFRGGPGDDEDSKSAAKRAANVGRAAIYLSFTAAAVRLLTSSADSSGSGGGRGASEQRSTAAVLDWPAGRWIVVAVGLVIIGTGVWNGWRAVKRSFLDALDLHELDDGPRRTVEVLGIAGYLARFAAFSLVGWFLVTAGLQHDPEETRGLDQALRELAQTSHGPILLFILAVGLVTFGVYRVLDAIYRRTSELTHA